MRKLILKMSQSLDGFIGRLDGGADWIFDTEDRASEAWTVETVGAAGLHAMGRRTWQDMAAFWPTSVEAYADPMNVIPKVVFTRAATLANDETISGALRDARADRAARGEADAEVDPDILDSWLDPRVANGDMGEELRRLKAEDGGPIVAHGGARFAQSLVATGEIDEFRLLVHPVALGAGLPLFPEGHEQKLQLVEAIPFPTGTTAMVYRPRP